MLGQLDYVALVPGAGMVEEPADKLLGEGVVAEFLRRNGWRPLACAGCASTTCGTPATRCFSVPPPRVVMDILGHTTLAMTMERYATALSGREGGRGSKDGRADVGRGPG